MKRLKLYAVVGGLTAAAFLPYAAAFAADEVGSDAEVSRGIALGDLLERFSKQAPLAAQQAKAASPTASTPVAKTVTVKPVAAHVAAKSVGLKVPTVAKAQPAAKTTVAKATNSGQSTAANTVASVPEENLSNTILASFTGQAAVTASLDKPGKMPKYKTGDELVVTVKATQDCNVLVFDYDSHGTLTQIFPNSFQTNGSMKAGQTVEVGGVNSGYILGVGGKGVERVFVYAYPQTEKDITVAMAPGTDSPFRSMDLSFEQYKQLVEKSRNFQLSEKKASDAAVASADADRSLTVLARKGAKAAPTKTSEIQETDNKLELTFEIDK